MYSQIGGAVGGIAGSSFGPAGKLAGSVAGQKLGEYLDKTPEEKQLEAMQKAQLGKLKRGDYLGPSQAEINKSMMGVQQQSMAAQQQIAADQQRQAAMGGARSGAFFQQGQQAAQAQQNALAQARLGVEENAQKIAEDRNRAYQAMLQRRAMEEQQKRGIRGKEGEMVADTRDYGTEASTALEGVSGGDLGLLSKFLAPA
jgi:hypothetical protein